MKKVIFVFVVLVLVVAGIFLVKKPVVQAPTNTSQEVRGESVTIEMSDEGFSPKNITIKPGTTVIFKAIGNNSDGYWPASAIHPTHTVYPGSDIKKCETDEQKNIFDACRGYRQGESWAFTFNQKGIWRYHDHNHSSLFGVITVE